MEKMEKKVYVIINEQHKLFAEQKKLLNRKFGNGWEFLKVPAAGWSLEKQRDIIKKRFQRGEIAVFASPIPYLLYRLSWSSGAWANCQGNNLPDNFAFCREVWIFHNDVREKKELPNGKIIQVVAEKGWQLV